MNSDNERFNLVTKLHNEVAKFADKIHKEFDGNDLFNIMYDSIITFFSKEAVSLLAMVPKEERFKFIAGMMKEIDYKIDLYRQFIKLDK